MFNKLDKKSYLISTAQFYSSKTPLNYHKNLTLDYLFLVVTVLYKSMFKSIAFCLTHCFCKMNFGLVIALNTIKNSNNYRSTLIITFGRVFV